MTIFIKIYVHIKLFHCSLIFNIYIFKYIKSNNLISLNVYSVIWDNVTLEKITEVEIFLGILLTVYVI